MDSTDNQHKPDHEKIAGLINKNRAAAEQSMTVSAQTARFWRFGLPRFLGLKLGIGIGVLVLAEIAGMAWLYELIWHLNGDTYPDTTTFQGNGLVMLYTVLTFGLLGLTALGLPLLMVWGKGKTRAIVTFSLEFLIILAGIFLALWLVNPDQTDTYDYSSCGVGMQVSTVGGTCPLVDPSIGPFSLTKLL